MQRQREYSHPMCASADVDVANLQDAKTKMYCFSYPREAFPLFQHVLFLLSHYLFVFYGFTWFYVATSIC